MYLVGLLARVGNVVQMRISFLASLESLICLAFGCLPGQPLNFVKDEHGNWGRGWGEENSD